VKKFLAVLIFSIILFVQANFVLADEGDPCCSDGDCGTLKCFCIPDPLPANWSEICDVSDPDNLKGPWGTCHPAGSVVFCPPSTIRSISDLINSITDWVFKIAIIVAPLMLVIGAILFMTARGNPEQIKLGKKIIFWTVIGFLIVLFAEGIINLIDYILGVK